MRMIEKGICGSCVHEKVCAHKEQFKAVREAVDTLDCLQDNDLINPVKVTCKYWITKEGSSPVYR